MLAFPQAGASSRRPAHCRAQRRPFVPILPPNPYRLPPAVLDRLTRDLAPFRNRDAALALAILLARFWSAPARITLTFPVDRRALAGHAALAGMTEARVRGALATLEKTGFVSRPPIVGRTHQRTAEGLHRRPILWRFDPEVVGMFRAAHSVRRAVQGGHLAPRRPFGASARECPPARPAAAPAMSPKHKAPAEIPMIMGDHLAIGTVTKGSRWETPSTATPCPVLGAALDRLMAARTARLTGGAA